MDGRQVEEMTDFSDYQQIIGYGIGSYFTRHRKEILNSVPFTCLCDADSRKQGAEIHGLKVFAPEELHTDNHTLIVLCALKAEIEHEVRQKYKEAEIMSVRNILSPEEWIDTDFLKCNLIEGKWQDIRNNRILIDGNISEKLRLNISFVGGGELIIGNHVTGTYNIILGNEGRCIIESGVTSNGCKILGSYGKIVIGEDCMLSYGIEFRQTHGHHIFDVETGERINYNKDVIIGKHVWIGESAILISGFHIGNGSVVGAGAISSSNFPENVIVAGSPARITRKGICWERDDTMKYNKHQLTSDI